MIFPFQFQQSGLRLSKRRNRTKMLARSEPHFIGKFKNGQVNGHFWVGLCHSGYIHGIADENGQATGDDMVFIYPDGETAYRYVHSI